MYTAIKRKKEYYPAVLSYVLCLLRININTGDLKFFYYILAQYIFTS